jgi:pimeloyl-ACP methyl ester carboxylesterase
MEHFGRGDLLFDVIDAGPADGPVVVLLHGFPETNAMYRPVIDRLTAKGYRTTGVADHALDAIYSKLGRGTRLH